MPGTLHADLRDSLIDDMVSNLDVLALQNAGGTDIVVYTGITWGAASAGRRSVASTPLSANSTSGDTITQAEYRDAVGTSEDITGLLVDIPATASWAATTAYSVNDRVISNTRHYKCKEAHTSSAAGATGDEPGTGDGFRDYWDEINIRLNVVTVVNDQTVEINSAFLEVPNTLF